MASTVWKGHLTFGLVSLPVKLYSAARGKTVSFNQLHKTDHSRVKQVLYCQAEDKPISRDEIVKGYEYEKDKYVVIDDADIKKAAPKSASTMEVLEFIKSSDVDPIFFESSYYMAPDDAGEKPYALLFEALRRTGHVGVAKIAMHSREHIVILRPAHKGIVLHTMYFVDELRQSEEYHTDTKAVKDKELELASSLIESLEAPFEPEKYKDTYRENLMTMIEAKAEGRHMVAAPPTQHLAPVVDIMEALKASLAEAKKPVRRAETIAAQQEEEAVGETPRKRRPRKASGD